MSINNNLDKDKQFGGNEFVDDIIYKNIKLMDKNVKLNYENIKLIYENRKLRRKVKELQANIQGLEKLNKEAGIAALIKDGEGVIVLVIISDREEYKM